MKKLTAITLITVMAIAITGCSRRGETIEPESQIEESSVSEIDEPRKLTTDEAAKYNSVIKPESVNLIQFNEPDESDEIAVITTAQGDIRIRLFREQAPDTVETFLKLADSGYYDNQPFRTAIPGYKLETGIGGTGEFPEDGEFSLDLWNFRGAVTLANNGNNFMIVTAYQCLNPKSELEERNFPKKVIDKYEDVGGAPHQDWENTVFGQVISGMDVVDKIMNATPKEPLNEASSQEEEADSDSTQEKPEYIVIEQIALEDKTAE